MRLSPNPIVTGSVVALYLVLPGDPRPRATSILVQRLVHFPEFLARYPVRAGPGPFQPQHLVDPFSGGSIGLALNEGAYMSEVVRAGLISVDEGQTEAAQSIGMSRFMTLRLIVVPQAMRVIIPPTGNETISMLKTTSLASVVTSRAPFTVEQIMAPTTT